MPMGKKVKKKTSRNKIDKYLSSDSLDLFSEEDYYNDNPPAPKGKIELREERLAKQSETDSPQLLGKIHQIFSLLLQYLYPEK